MPKIALVILLFGFVLKDYRLREGELLWEDSLIQDLQYCGF